MNDDTAGKLFVIFFAMIALVILGGFLLIGSTGVGCRIEANHHQSNFQVVVDGRVIAFKPTRDEALSYMHNLPECQDDK